MMRLSGQERGSCSNKLHQAPGKCCHLYALNCAPGCIMNSCHCCHCASLADPLVLRAPRCCRLNLQQELRSGPVTVAVLASGQVQAVAVLPALPAAAAADITSLFLRQAQLASQQGQQQQTASSAAGVVCQVWQQLMQPLLTDMCYVLGTAASPDADGLPRAAVCRQLAGFLAAAGAGEALLALLAPVPAAATGNGSADECDAGASPSPSFSNDNIIASTSGAGTSGTSSTAPTSASAACKGRGAARAVLRGFEVTTEAAYRSWRLQQLPSADLAAAAVQVALWAVVILRNGGLKAIWNALTAAYHAGISAVASGSLGPAAIPATLQHSGMTAAAAALSGSSSPVDIMVPKLLLRAALLLLLVLPRFRPGVYRSCPDRAVQCHHVLHSLLDLLTVLLPGSFAFSHTIRDAARHTTPVMIMWPGLQTILDMRLPAQQAVLLTVMQQVDHMLVSRSLGVGADVYVVRSLLVLLVASASALLLDWYGRRSFLARQAGRPREGAVGQGAGSKAGVGKSA